MVDFQLYEYEGKRVLVFDVASRPLGLPVQVDGVAWWYEADSLIPLPQDIQRQIYEETGHDFSGDICPGATMDDLDETAIEVFRQLWKDKSGNKRLANLSARQLLKDAGAIEDEDITYAALILFGTKKALRKYLPHSEVVFEYRSSEAAGPAAQREEFVLGYFAYYNRIWELINLRNDKQHYQDGMVIYDISTFNEQIVREAVLNAVSHRQYQLAGSIFVRQYRDRLVVESPGGFPLGVTTENILYKQAPRNRRIAEIFALSGLVERSGQGMDLMYELSVCESKELPNFIGSDNYLVRLTLNGLILDKQLLLFLKKIGEEQKELLSTDDFLVIDALFHDKPLNKHLRLRLKCLIDMGIIEHIGRGKYVLARGLYETTGKSGVHTRIVGLDRETNKALLVKHIQSNGNKGTPFKELEQVLPSHSRNQIKVLIRELRQSDVIYVVGKTSSSLWYVR
jgi:ATP-dependent DNA helicase RecG